MLISSFKDMRYKDMRRLSLSRMALTRMALNRMALTRMALSHVGLEPATNILLLTQTLSVTSLHTSRPEMAVQLPRPAQLLNPTAFGAARRTPRRTQQRSCTMVRIMQHRGLWV